MASAAVDSVLARLEGVKRNGQGNVPAHLRGRRRQTLRLTEPDELTRAQREIERIMREKP
jgi:hypothetical protein